MGDNLPPMALASHRMLVQALAALHPIQLPADVPRRMVEDGPNAWPSHASPAPAAVTI